MIGKFSELPYHTKSPPGDAHSREWKMLPSGNRARRENYTLWNSFSYDRKVLRAGCTLARMKDAAGQERTIFYQQTLRYSD